MKTYIVKMNRKGLGTSINEVDPVETRLPPFVFWTFRCKITKLDGLAMVVRGATSTIEAVEIANRRRLKLINDGTWDVFSLERQQKRLVPARARDPGYELIG